MRQASSAFVFFAFLLLLAGCGGRTSPLDRTGAGSDPIESPMAAASDDAMPPCDQALQPTHMVAPRWPAILHNEFEGVAVVSFVVGSNGRVRDPVVRALDVHPVGNARGEPQGYSEAITAAVVQWTYPTAAHACRADVSLRIEFE